MISVMGDDRPASSPSEQELRLLKIVWARGVVTVRTILDQLGDDAPAYTTVQTVLNRMVKKRLLRRTKAGKEHRYAATSTESLMKGSLIKSLIDRVFGGSAPLLIQNLLHTGQVREEELELLARQLENARKGDRGNAKGKE
jgi:predicted transcriptional regulator